MMSFAQEFRNVLGQQFDVAFQVDQEFHNHEPILKVIPEKSHEDFFMVRMEFKNHNRLNLTFNPQKYSANMIRSMGHASDEKKAQFCSFGSILTSADAKISFYLNDAPASITDYSEWPDEWSKVLLRVSIMPVERDEDDNVDYSSTLNKYALCFVGMILSLLDIVPCENDEVSGYAEGKKKTSVSSRYERNPINRAICLQKYGYSCRICGMSFLRRYGAIGDRFIHVHHIIPVSQMGDNYIVDPLHDLIPVCPNCHAMLHRTDPPMKPEELKARFNANE